MSNSRSSALYRYISEIKDDAMTNSNEGRLGLPDMSAGGQRRPETEKKKSMEDGSPGALREGDSGLGQPSQSPEVARVLSEADEALVLGRILEPGAADAADEPVFQPIHLPPFLYSTTVLLIILCAATLFLLHVINSVIELVDKVNGYPSWMAGVWCCLILAASVLVIATAIRIILLYLRLSKSPQIRINGLEDLNNRQTIRKSMSSINVAKNELSRFVRSYRISENPDSSRLLNLGFQRDEIDSLRRQQETLMDPDCTPSAEEWLRNFQDRFLSVIDQAAERRVRSSALLVAAKTAIAPRGIVDTLIVVYSSFKLIGDLCAIYNLRMSGLSTAAILVRAFVIAYLAGRVQDAAEKISDELYKHVAGVAGAAANLLTAKTAEAAANGFLIWRLGKTTIAMVRPVRR